MPGVKIKLTAGTDAGLVRSNNEDNFVVSSDLSASEWIIPQVGACADLGDFGALMVVADGMGGANAGEVASAIAVETIQAQFVPARLSAVVQDDKSVQEFMKTVVRRADRNILDRSNEDPDTQGMGTTIVMAWILGERAYVCWCGDSRCYVLNKRNGLVRLSKDHSYVQELIDKGELVPEYASDHPLSNVITRCLGDVDLRANPDTRVWELHDGDTIMLCSDGLSGLCSDERIYEIMTEFRENPVECKNELISAALSNGGHDNVTVALCNIYKDDEGGEEQNAGTVSTSDDLHPAEENLSATVRSEVIGRKGGHRLGVICLLLVVILSLCAYVCCSDGFETFRHDVMATFCSYFIKMKNVVQ